MLRLAERGELDLEYRSPKREQVSPEVVDLVRRGKKIEAIKLYRGHTDVGLKEARDMIELIEAEQKAAFTGRE